MTTSHPTPTSSVDDGGPATIGAKIGNIRVRHTPNGRNPYYATLKGFGEFGWGATAVAAREKLIELLSRRGDVRIEPALLSARKGGAA